MKFDTDNCPECGGWGFIPSIAALKDERLEVGLSQAEVAKAMIPPHSRSFVCAVESGAKGARGRTRTLIWDAIQRLAEAKR